MFYPAAPVAAGLVATGTLVTFVSALDSPEPVRGIRCRLLQVGGFVLLLLGVAVFVAAAAIPGDRLRLGSSSLPFAALLLADGLLATVRTGLAGRLLTVCGALCAPLTALLMLLTYLFDPDGFARTDVTPLVLAVGLLTVPAMLTGALFSAAGRPRIPPPVLAARRGALRP
jgi:hypothetical protein